MILKKIKTIFWKGINIILASLKMSEEKKVKGKDQHSPLKKEVPVANIVLLGDPTVGKTSIFKRFSQGSVNAPEIPTISKIKTKNSLNSSRQRFCFQICKHRKCGDKTENLGCPRK